MFVQIKILTHYMNYFMKFTLVSSPYKSKPTNCYDKSFVRTKIRRVRSSGCVAPKKCSSPYRFDGIEKPLTQCFNF